MLVEQMELEVEGQKRNSNKRICRICKKEKAIDDFYRRGIRRGKQIREYRCKECMNPIKTNRVYTNRFKKYKALNNDKGKIQDRIRHAVHFKGFNKSNKCEICNVVKPRNLIVGHHQDYSKPLEVIWLCPQCHADIHRRQRYLACMVSVNSAYPSDLICGRV